jgi:hypothetical protein
MDYVDGMKGTAGIIWLHLLFTIFLDNGFNKPLFSFVVL